MTRAEPSLRGALADMLRLSLGGAVALGFAASAFGNSVTRAT